MAKVRTSNLWGGIAILLFICFLMTADAALALDGSGTEEDPWRIKSLADFNDFAADANYWTGFTRLETDVNLAGRVYEMAVVAPDVNNVGGFQGTAFTGVFDGNDYKILNLTVDTAGADNDYLGLFGRIGGEQAQVKNLGLEDVIVIGGDHSWFLGGLCGYNYEGTLSNCYATGLVTAGDNSYDLGGLCGGNSGTLSNCYATGSVTGGDNSHYLGGLCGSNLRNGTLSKCYATGSVTVRDDSRYLGGLCGDNFGTFSNCYATGSVTAGDNSYYLGGLLGKIYQQCIVSNCFWDIETSGMSVSAGGTGKTTAEMHQQSTFTDWDFINVWNIGENQTYPYLRTVSAGDINKDHITNFLDLCIVAEQWANEK